MKKIIALFIICSSFLSFSATITSIADGNWSNPTTWDCNCVPTLLDEIIVAHNVSLDVSFTVANSLTVQSGKELSAANAQINFALATGTIENNGTMTLYNFASNGNLLNNETITATNFINNDTLTNNGTLDITNFSNHGGFYNQGIMNLTDFTNAGYGTNDLDISFVNFRNSVHGYYTNNGTMAGTVDATNAGWFYNTTNGDFEVQNNFMNDGCFEDTVILINDGMFTVGNSFASSDTVKGNGGSFYIIHNTANIGVITGTIDFCDSTPPLYTPYIDFNMGIVGNDVTFCESTKIKDIKNSIQISTYPNPSDSYVKFEFNNYQNQNYDIELFNQLGKIADAVYNVKTETIILYKNNLPAGMYFYRIKCNNGLYQTGKLIFN